MASAGFSKTSFKLLEDLEQNNDKDWMAERRDEFKTHLQEPFARMLDLVSRMLDGDDPTLSGGKHTMFRLHRDTRFSKNKAPYNLHVSGLLTKSGRKSESGGLAYARIDADGGRMAAGFYGLNAKQLAPFRDKMIEQPEKWQAVIDSLSEGGFEMSEMNAVKTMPRGYKHAEDHEFARYIKLKSLVAFAPLTRTDWTQGRVPEKLVALAKASAPLLRFGG